MDQANLINILISNVAELTANVFESDLYEYKQLVANLNSKIYEKVREII